MYRIGVECSAFKADYMREGAIRNQQRVYDLHWDTTPEDKFQIKLYNKKSVHSLRKVGVLKERAIYLTLLQHI